jgi:hypothetical protein
MLPDALKDASIGKRVLVSRRPDGLLLVAFKIWYGRRSNMAGYLYASRPLAAVDMGADPHNNPAVLVGGVPLHIESKIDDQWSFVSYRLD